jgi:hypothetical protein
MLTNETMPPDSPDVIGTNWADDAPRGGRTVMNRILKENATVPLFFAQTLVQSLRDVGYNHTTSAMCEHVDNAIQAGATVVRIYFRQSGKRGQYEIDAAVYDNGHGMPPAVLKVAMAFGGSMSFGNRQGIGRFGMGMKTAALSMSPIPVRGQQEKNAALNFRERHDMPVRSQPRGLAIAGCLPGAGSRRSPTPARWSAPRSAVGSTALARRSRERPDGTDARYHSAPAGRHRVLSTVAGRACLSFCPCFVLSTHRPATAMTSWRSGVSLVKPARPRTNLWPRRQIYDRM